MYQLHFKLKTKGDDLRVAVTHAGSTIKDAFFEFLKKHGHELWQRVLAVDLYSGITDRSMEFKPKDLLKVIGCQKVNLKMLAGDLRREA